MYEEVFEKIAEESYINEMDKLAINIEDVSTKDSAVISRLKAADPGFKISNSIKSGKIGTGVAGDSMLDNIHHALAVRPKNLQKYLDKNKIKYNSFSEIEDLASNDIYNSMRPSIVRKLWEM